MESAVKQRKRELPTFEQIRKFKILDREFSIEHGELTPTMKLRRSRALENHRALVTKCTPAANSSEPCPTNLRSK